LLKKLHYVYKSDKLIHILLEHTTKTPTQDCTISSIRITGDFFVYPEESLDELEAALTGTKLEDMLSGKRYGNGCRDLKSSVSIQTLTEAFKGCFQSGEDNHKI